MGHVCPNGAFQIATAEATIEWYTRARMACEQFIFASMRYRTPWVDEELLGDLELAREWHRANASPDPSMGVHLWAILDAYGEMTTATVARVMELRQAVERHVSAMDSWKLPLGPANRPAIITPGRRPMEIRAVRERQDSGVR
jgi:hypothetical protein